MARCKSPFSPCEVRIGLEALNKGNQNKICQDNLEVVGSVDIDACFKAGEPNSPRWDYYIDIKRKGELYLEVHEVSEEEIQRILKKAGWLREKIEALNWPFTENRSLFVAPTKGISPFELYGALSKRLALHKITVIRAGDDIAKLLD